jgi:hypothetical protein
VPCSAPDHNHWQGGGDHWRHGYSQLIKQARAASAPHKPALVSESNGEQHLNTLNGFLTLQAFGVGDFAGKRRVVPAFSAIYGGYYIGLGAGASGIIIQGEGWLMVRAGLVFTDDDFADEAAAFRAKLAGMFVFGAQLGWFSLGGASASVLFAVGVLIAAGRHGRCTADGAVLAADGQQERRRHRIPADAGGLPPAARR